MKRRLFAFVATAFACSMTAHAALKVGDAAPAIDAKDQDEKAVTSTELYKNGTTLFFFYPKAGTGG